MSDDVEYYPDHLCDECGMVVEADDVVHDYDTCTQFCSEACKDAWFSDMDSEA